MIKIKNLNFSRGGRSVLGVQSVAIDQGERISLLGPSGSGKTTFLRLIAGLESEANGTIELKGIKVSGKHYVPPSKRSITMLTQEYGLWGHLTTLQHLAFVRRSGRGVQPSESDRQLLELVGLGHKNNAYPAQLSGGEKQRLALARAMSKEADILLLDEPFSNVDAVLSHELLSLLESYQKQRKTTRIMVTHDPDEAIRTSDRIFVMENGALVDQCTWQELCANPQGEWSKRLVEMYG